MDSQSIGSLIDDILDGNATSAREKFDYEISSKVTDALEQRKKDIAASLYNDSEYQDIDETEEEQEQ